jgi:hypothetical protein
MDRPWRTGLIACVNDKGQARAERERACSYVAIGSPDLWLLPIGILMVNALQDHALRAVRQ